MVTSVIKAKPSSLGNSIAWHSQMASLAGKEPHLEGAAALRAEAAKLEQKMNEALSNRRPEVKLKAKEYQIQMKQKLFQAKYVENPIDSEAQLKHLLTNVQLKAVASNTDVTQAVVKLIAELKETGSPELIAAIAKDKSLRRLGLN